ncbi:MAG: DUF502 domain-containing protein [Candidatus Omnitrophica bacterium]|nr:DUF502 domain-containing protein [Candidatus Omnitrophota bacterium]
MRKKLRGYFVSGLIIFLPLSLTIYLLIFTFSIADNFLGKYIQPYFAREFGFYIQGISILVCFLFILLIGFLMTNFLSRKIYPVLEGWLVRLPFFKQVYPAFKQMAIFLFSPEKMAFRQVVLIEYPRKGVYSYGFLTNKASEKVMEKIQQDVCHVFIPSAPGPLTGFVLLVPRKDLIYVDISVEEAVRTIVSGGVVNSMERR